jgi:acyl-CoA synthetase (AMP-forming)/AMP-acid ligase II
MSKALGLLPSWYWPEGVQRYLAAPRVAIYELAVNRWARRYGNDPALVVGEGVLSFRDLDAACARVTLAIARRFPGEAPKVALAVRSGDTFVPLFLGLLRANASVLVLAAPDELALQQFAPDLVVSDLHGVAGDAPTVLLEGEPASTSPRPVMVDASRPAIALPGRDGLAWHSHASLMSGAMAFAAFLAVNTKDRLLVARPPASWEALIGLLAPLQAGAAAVACDPADRDAVAALVRGLQPSTVWIDEPAAEALLAGHDALADALRAVRPKVYVSGTGLRKHVRRALRHRLRAHVLSVYGYPECGPIAASHASWYLDDSVGIPMVGVDLLALNPETGQPSLLPWPVLSYAGIGAKTQSVATNRRTAPAAEMLSADAPWYVTGDHGILDSNGMLFLRER